MNKSFLNFHEFSELYSETPPDKMLWSGIKEKSFGLVFGPAKSGKTIFCENLALALATGKEEFLGYPLEGKPRKILFLGLEEFWRNRAERVIKRTTSFNEEERLLLDENFLVQNTEFSRTIKTPEQWIQLNEIISDSKAEVVIIDSITRMNRGKLEDSKDAEKLMLNLRTLSQEMGITLIAIHHTPKMYGNPITIDSIKGSSTFAQEADFAIGINRAPSNRRYLKNVFFRYADDNDDFVYEFQLSESFKTVYLGQSEESHLLNGRDGRTNDAGRNLITSLLEDNPGECFTTKKILKWVSAETGLKERAIKYQLKELSKNGSIDKTARGIYRSAKGSSGDNKADNE